jgi:hypothetical protein
MECAPPLVFESSALMLPLPPAKNVSPAAASGSPILYQRAWLYLRGCVCVCVFVCVFQVFGCVCYERLYVVFLRACVFAYGACIVRPCFWFAVLIPLISSSAASAASTSGKCVSLASESPSCSAFQYVYKNTCQVSIFVLVQPTACA